jgi:hypothetical protein
MTALVQVVFRWSDNASAETETLKMLAIFCGAGLLVSVLFAICGPAVDLTPGFF